jgi:dTDP-4-dehydrorhamnose reductase
VIAAGVTSIAACEQDPAGTRLVNVDAALRLARRARAQGVTPVAFSSDYVFDGRDPPYDDDGPIRPLNEYGRQKADLEQGFAALGDSLVVRLSKAYGAQPGDGTLLDEMVSAFRRGQVVRAARDQVFSPVAVGDVVAGVLALCDAKCAGVVNVSGPEDWSRLDLARAVARAVGASLELVMDISLDDLGEAFLRPKDTRMRTGRLRRLTGVRPRGVRSVLA